MASFAASLLGANLLVQSILFVTVSVVLLAVTRPLAVEFFNKGRTKTNAESLIGKTAVVQQEIDNLKAAGMVTVDGQEWSARSKDDSVIPVRFLRQTPHCLISAINLLPSAWC